MFSGGAGTNFHEHLHRGDVHKDSRHGLHHAPRLLPQAQKYNKENPQKIREAVTYYFADFVRKKGGGLPPKSVTPFLLKILSVKGGTPKIRNFFLPKFCP